MSNNLSYSQKKRAKLDYRKEYFKHNPGLFGNIWFCSQCGRPLVGKHNVQVDHIVPLNSIAGKNRRYNLVAICPTCNRQKSDNGGVYIVKGSIAKVFEVLMFTAQKIVIVAIAAAAYVVRAIIMMLVGVIKAPLEYLSGTSQMVAYVIIFGILLFVLKSVI